MDRIYNKTCVICGKDFTAHKNVAKYCEDCKDKAYDEVKKKSFEKNREIYMEHKRMKRATQKEEKKNGNHAERMKPLLEMNKKARAAHMSYGQYVAKYG